MDIEEYLRQKKELEKKKEYLEKKEELSKEKSKHSFTTHAETSSSDLGGEPHHPSRPSRDHGTEYRTNHWIFLSIAFIIALIVIGMYALYYFFPKDTLVTTPTEATGEVDELKQQLEELQKTLEDIKEEPDEEKDTNATSEEDDESDKETSVTAIGPEFELHIQDDWDEEVSYGIFDEFGKINGERLNIIGDEYKYTVVIKNLESTRIKCELDEEIFFDTDSDGRDDDELTQVKLNWQVIELSLQEEDSFKDSVMESGIITANYEARCFFCETNDCDDWYEEGEEINRATFKITLQEDTTNQTSS